jgi:hypothetical protein
MKHTIKRGALIIGTIDCPGDSGASVYGMEVLVESAFPAVDPDADTQFESYERGEKYLQSAYEAHCEAKGIEAMPMPAASKDLDQEDAWYMRAREAEEAAYYASQMEGVVEEVPAGQESLPASAELPPVASDEADDFPF